jgi:Glutaminase
MAIKSWLTLTACFLAFQSIAKADTVYTTVFNVFESTKTERLLILSGVDGRIYKTHKNDAQLKRMKSLLGQIVRLDYVNQGKEAVITNIQIAQPNEVDTRTADLNRFRYNQLREFAPTDLQSVEKATDLFNNMLNDGDKGRSQCFKRAHMWAYDMWSKLNIQSEKLFIFYTKRYAILEDFEWWFHVAPLVTVNGEKYVMDGTFMEKPITVKEWKDYFIKSDKITCPLIDKYQDFENNQWNRLCYLMEVPMYYFSPLNIENRDKQGTERNHWVLDELQDARRAFKNYEETYEGLDTGKSTTKY